jgi:hypothetical protein
MQIQHPNIIYSSCRETAKNAIKKKSEICFKKEEKGTYLPHLVTICQIHVAFIFLLLWRPLERVSVTTGHTTT